MYDSPEYLIVFQVTIVMLSVLALRLKLWQKSGTTFAVIIMMMGMMLFRSFFSIEVYVYWHPIILSVFLFLITTRAVVKERNDKIFGDLHRHDRRKDDVKHMCKKNTTCRNYQPSDKECK